MSGATTPKPWHHRALAFVAASLAIGRLLYGALLATAAMLGQRIAVGIFAVMRALLTVARG